MLKRIVIATSVFSVAYFASERVKAETTENLIINSMHSDPSAKKAFASVVGKFKKKHPNINVTINTIDHESYKVQLRTWLPHNPPDIATWFAGNRAKFFIDRGLIEPIDDVWAGEEKNFSKAALASVTYDGKKYLMPTSYYHWGFFYRTDLFKEAGIDSPPKTWAEFLKAIDKLNNKKIRPITIGAKNGWPAAAWFDFLNLRINGYAFYMELMKGQKTYQDPKVSKVMDVWKQVVDKKAFIPSASALSWQEAAALLWQGRAAMYLMGNFIAVDIPKGAKGKIGFFPFPEVDPKVEKAEVAPTDVYFIPAKAKNKTTAKKFIKFLASVEAQTTISQYSSILPPNQKVPIPESRTFLVQGKNLLQGAHSLSQFYDRDADPRVAKVGMDGFVEFMIDPSRKNKILKKIDKIRRRVHRTTH